MLNSIPKPTRRICLVMDPVVKGWTEPGFKFSATFSSIALHAVANVVTTDCSAVPVPDRSTHTTLTRGQTSRPFFECLTLVVRGKCKVDPSEKLLFRFLSNSVPSC